MPKLLLDLVLLPAFFSKEKQASGSWPLSHKLAAKRANPAHRLFYEVFWLNFNCRVSLKQCVCFAQLTAAPGIYRQIC